MPIDVSSILGTIQSARSEGKNPLDAALGDVPTSAVDSVSDEEEAGSLEAEDTDNPPAEDESETKEEANTSEEVKVEDAAAKEPPKTKEDKEVVVWGGKEVVIDYADREQIKKNTALAIGARKWQAERDAAQAKLTQLEPDYKDAVEFRSAVTGAFEKEGLSGLVNLLTNDAEGYKKLRAQIVDEERAYANATPEQKALLDEKRANEALRRELEADRKLREKQIKEAEEREAKATQATEQANVTAFTEITGASAKKHSFSEKLGNPDLEDALDNKVWNKVKAELSQLPEDTEVTPKLMDGLFAKHAEALQKGLSLKAAKEADKRVEEKKVQAQTKVAATAAASMGKRSAAEEFNEATSKGNFADAIKMALSGKVKLGKSR